MTIEIISFPIIMKGVPGIKATKSGYQVDAHPIELTDPGTRFLMLVMLATMYL